MSQIWQWNGESKVDYCKRSVRENIKQKHINIDSFSEMEFNKLISTYDRVIEKLINNKGCIALIPTKNEKYELNIAYPSQKDLSNRKFVPPEKYYDSTASNYYVSNCLGGMRSIKRWSYSRRKNS